MVSYRAAESSEKEACIHLANLAFREAGSPTVFERDLPKVYGPDADGTGYHLVAADDEKGLRAMVATLPGCLHIGRDTLHIGYVGTVCVHPEDRGQGHMKKLMAMTLERAARMELDLLMLGGRRQRYAYFGFETAGYGYDAVITADNLRHALPYVDSTGIQWLEIQPDTPEEAAAKALSQNQWAAMERNPFAVICRSYHAVPFAAVRNRKMIGYAVRKENSHDFSEILAENELSLEAMLKSWQESRILREFHVSIPGWNRPLLSHLNRFAEIITLVPNSRTRILRWRHTLEVLLRLKGQGCHLEDGFLTLRIEKEWFALEVKDGRVFSFDSPQNDMIPLCFSPSEAEKIFLDPFSQDEQERFPRGWFPLPLYQYQSDEF